MALPIAVRDLACGEDRRLCPGRGGKDETLFIRCVNGSEPQINELWHFAEDGTCKVHPFARIQISAGFVGDTFHTDFVGVDGRHVALLGDQSVNGSVKWLNVPQPFIKSRIQTADWVDNIFRDPLVGRPKDFINVVPNHIVPMLGRINNFTDLRMGARHVRDDLFWAHRNACIQPLRDEDLIHKETTFDEFFF